MYIREIFSPASTPSDGSPPSLTLRIPKDQLRGLSAGKTGQSGSSRLQLRTKLTRSKAWLQEYLTSEDPLKMYMAAVYEHTDPTGVCVAEVFHELPSVKVQCTMYMYVYTRTIACKPVFCIHDVHIVLPI